jgi:uncharacterized protein (TIGR00369 family)
VTPLAGPRAIAVSGPEHLFRYTPVRADGTQVVGSMTTGPWLARPGHEPGAGALAVLVDNVLGHAIIGDSPDGQLSVSTEIGIDLIGKIPVDGSTVHARASSVDTDAIGGLATGEVVDAAGNIIARCRQRGRFLEQRPVAGPNGRPLHKATAQAQASDLVTLIGSVTPLTEDDGALELTVSPTLANPLGILHGGISFCVSDWLGAEALRPLRSASVNVAYLRPVPADGRVRFTAEVVHAGRGLGVARVMGRNQAGKLCTVATVIAH